MIVSIRRVLPFAAVCLLAGPLRADTQKTQPPQSTPTKAAPDKAAAPEESGEDADSPGSSARPTAPADNRIRAEAEKTMAVVVVENRKETDSAYLVRWKLYNGAWSDWKKYDSKSNTSWTLWCKGATAGQIRFDRYANDDKVTEWTVNLPVVRVPSTRDPKQVGAPVMFFRYDGTTVKLYRASKYTEDYNLKYKAVVAIHNHHSAPAVSYLIRWKRFDKTWSQWKSYRISSGYDKWHWMTGATDAEIKFDSVGGDGRTTPKTYHVAVNRISASRTPTKYDGRGYKFEYTSSTRLDFFKN